MKELGGTIEVLEGHVKDMKDNQDFTNDYSIDKEEIKATKTAIDILENLKLLGGLFPKEIDSKMVVGEYGLYSHEDMHCEGYNKAIQESKLVMAGLLSRRKTIKLIDVREVINDIISEEISMSRGQEILNEQIKAQLLSVKDIMEELVKFKSGIEYQVLNNRVIKDSCLELLATAIFEAQRGCDSLWGI